MSALVASWLVFALGVGHSIVSIVMYKKPLLAAVSEGYWNKFKSDKNRTLGFWMFLFGPMLAFLGYLCVFATQTANAELQQLLGAFIFLVGIAGAAAIPKTPFWVAVALGPVIFLAGS